MVICIGSMNKKNSSVSNSKIIERLINSGDIIYFQCDRNRPHRFKFISPNVKKIFGYSADDFYTNDNLWFNCIHPDNRQKVKSVYSDLIDGVIKDITYQFLHKDGSYIWVKGELHNYYDEADHNQYIIGTSISINDKIEIEDKIGEQKERLSVLEDAVSRLSDIVIIHKYEEKNRRPELVYVNNTFTHRTGYSIDEANSRFPEIMWGSNTDRHVLQKLEKAYQNREPIYGQEIVNYTKDQKEFWASLDMIPFNFENSDKQYNVIINRDITDKKLYEKLLEGQLNVLDMIARGLNLKVILKTIAKFVDDLNAHYRCAIYLTDEKKDVLKLFSAPKIPQSKCNDLSKMPVAEKACSTGKAAYLKERVVVENVFENDNCASYRKLSHELGIKSVYSNPVISDDGDVLGVITVYDDRNEITKYLKKGIDIASYLMNISIERKKNQATLEESQLKYKTVFDLAHDGIILAKDDRIVDCNDRALGMFEAAREKLIGMSSVELSPKIQPDGYKSSERALFYMNKTCEGIPQIFEWQHQTLNGKLFDVNISMKKLKIGDENYLLQVMRDVTKQKLYEQKILQSLEEKEVLLAEIHHRVKNNLAVISGLLDLQLSKIEKEEIQQVLNDSQSRIKTIALIHESLYNSPDLSRIEFGDYLDHLITNIQSTYMRKACDIEVHKSFDKIHLGIKQAIPCGLIANELIVNTYKHAFTGKSKGDITIELLLRDDDISLNVRDNGKGLPADFSFYNSDSLGIKLIATLTKQLDGELLVNNNGGAEFKLTFPLNNK